MTFDLDVIDPTLPDVSLKVGGKVRHLVFDYYAIILAEKLTGENMLSGLFEANFTSLGGMLFAALLHSDPELKLETVQSWINFKSAAVIHQALLSAWIGSKPEPKEGVPGEALAAETISPAA